MATATTVPSVQLPLWDQYTVAALVLASTILIVLAYLLFTSPPSSPLPSAHAGYTRLDDEDAESPGSTISTDAEVEVKHEVDGYTFELRKALGTPIDAAAYEARRLAVHITIALLSVVGLAIDATSIVSNLVSNGPPAQPLQTTLYFASTCAALRTLTVSLAMLHLNLTESTRLTFISLLSSFYLVAQLLVFLTDYKLFLPTLGGDSNVVLHSINIGSSLIVFLLAFLSPTGPLISVEATGGLPARTVTRNAIGGGSVAQDLLGFMALPLVHKAHTQNRLDEDDIPAIDYTYRSAVVAEQMIRNYRQCLASSLAKVPAGPKRTDSVKGRTLLAALAKCNASQLIATGIMLVIVTFAFYVPKFGLSLLLDGIEKYEASLRQSSTSSTGAAPAVDTVSKRARFTLIYSAIFYLTLFTENFLVYHYFRPLSIYLKTKMQTQLTTLLAWKRLRQKEASAKDQDANSDDTHSAAAAAAAAAKSSSETHAQQDEGGVSVSSPSQVINLVTTDAQRVFGRIDMYVFGIMGPLEVFIGGYSAYVLMGRGALIGLAAAALMQPIAFAVGKVTKRIDEKLQKARDRRVMLLSEAIRAIRMVKYEAWEDEIGAKIMLERRAELKCQAQSWIVYTFFGGLFAFVPMLTIVVAFAWYTLVEGNTLTASVAFPAVAVLNELRFAISYLPSNFLSVIQGWVSLKRIAVYMETGEVDISEDEYKPMTMNGANDAAVQASSAVAGRVELRQAEITWPSESDDAPASVQAPAPPSSASTFTLSIPDVTFRVGHINLVCGKIGSGKTLLLLSLLGEAQLISGKLECPRSHPAASLYAARSASASSSQRREWWIDLSLSAYAPQRPFLFNATVRENILFGLEYNARRYRDVIFACGLKPDLKIFKDGDRTEIGEGGTNLSGGQKARISLARAVYSHAGTVLIDDCLSALDSHTTKHVCETLFGQGKAGSGLLQGRTTILVTHHVRLMASRCKKVLVLQEGRQAFFGSAEQFTNSPFYEGLEDEDAKQKEQDQAETPNFGSSNTTAANSAANSDEEDAIEADDALLDAAGTNVAGGKHANASAVSQHAVDGAVQRPAVRKQPSASAFSHISGLHDGPVDGEAAPVEEEAHKQVTEEARAQGRVSFAVYSGYIRAGGGVLLWIALVGSFAAYAFSDLGANWWLRIWTQSARDQEHPTEWWLVRWIVIQSFQVAAMTAGYAFICTASLLAGSRLFKQLLRTVLRAPLRFHDSTPSGRLLNRFGKDMEAIDSNIAEELTEAAKALLIALAAVVATFLGGGPIVLVILSFMIPVFYVIVSTFTLAARDLKRLDSNSASKRITCFTDLITGVVTVRAFGSSSAYFATLMERLDENMMFYFWQGVVRQWQSLLLSLVSSVVVISTVLVVTLTPGFTAARAGFTLSFVQNLTSMLTYGMRSLSNVEQGLVAVERVMEYFGIETEPLDAAPASVQEPVAVPASWPEKGAIEIRDLHLAYAENLPDVLDGINLSIRPGERVGIVGATGSGKSTLVSALFRFFEYRSGRIEIDGVDIGKIGLKALRSRMKIVPQDPLILSGTLRSAVDPLGQHADEDITRVLVRVGLLKEKPVIATGYGTFDSSKPTSAANVVREGDSTSSSTLLSHSPPTPSDESTDDSGTLSSLEARIDESGGNLSSGQKQLLSLSRILLSANANSIVVLDESTSSIDYTTDAKIQALLDAHFSKHNTTVLAIAHRLRTIIGFDTVVVLERGRVVEKGSPKALLASEEGWFSRLARSTGEEEYAALRRALGV